MKKRFLIILANILFPLCLGTVFYLWIKPNAWCSEMIYRLLRMKKQKGFDENSIPVIGYFIKHQLCDVLFAYSMTFALFFVMEKQKRGTEIACIVAAVFETIFELSQLWGFPGNFDFLDILAEVIVTAIIYFCLKIEQTKLKRRTTET